MLVADLMSLPFIYVRPSSKKHGRKNQIEGYANPALPMVVIEDLISTGKSSLNAVKAIKEEGLEVLGMLALFSYGFNVAKENFETEKVQLNILSDYDHLLVFANEQNAITNEQRMALSSWRENPAQWKP